MNSTTYCPIPLADRRRRRRNLVCWLRLGPEETRRFRTGARQAHRVAVLNRRWQIVRRWRSRTPKALWCVAEMTEKDLVLAAHRVYIADRKVDTARALAETKFSEAGTHGVE